MFNAVKLKMSYEMISMLWKYNREKLKSAIYGTKEFYEYLTNVQAYSKNLKEMDKQIGNNSGNNHAY